MLIRSQDKKILANLNNLQSIFIEKSKEKYIVSLSVRKLGEYSTEEKAIKVLDMIQVTYMNLDYSRFLGEEKIEYFENVFVMPQDEEVKV